MTWITGYGSMSQSPDQQYWFPSCPSHPHLDIHLVAHGDHDFFEKEKKKAVSIELSGESSS